MKKIIELLLIIILLLGIGIGTIAMGAEEPVSLNQGASEPTVEPAGFVCGAWYWLTNDSLRVGMDDGHYADYCLGYGFRWPDSYSYEALAVGWWGEGWTLGYNNGAVLGMSYESGPFGGFTTVSETETIYGDRVVHTFKANVENLNIVQDDIVYFNEHDQALKITIKNNGTSAISGIRYKRIVDWDVDLPISPTGFANYWDYFNLSDGAEFQTATGTALNPGGYHQAALVVPGGGCSNPATLHDQNGWDDMSWGTNVQSLDRNGMLLDDNALFQWNFNLTPGEEYKIVLFYLIDNTTNWNNTVNITKDYNELFGKVCLLPQGNVTGGGWIVSPITPAPKNNNKATFGFVAHYADGATTPSGNLQYNDKAAGLTVHGNVTTLSVNKATNTATFSGTAKVNGVDGFAYTVTVVDNGEPGKTDTFAINIPGKSYTASGILGGGNIQIHDP